MVTADAHGRIYPLPDGDEAATLLGFLEYQRATLGWKSTGLDAAGLAATVAASSISIGGLLKHLARVEDWWCSVWLHGREPAAWWSTADWTADPNWDWNSAAHDEPAQLRSLWQQAVECSRVAVAESLAVGGLGQLAARRWLDGRAPSLRWILCHLIEEYARHNGHADLIREAIDGETGE
jgi:uncharacterized damage-inducible protein DinB